MRTRKRAVAHPYAKVLDQKALAVLSLVLPLLGGMAGLVVPMQAQTSGGLAAAFARMDKIAPQFKGVKADIRRDVYTAAISDHEFDMGTIKVKREKNGLRMLIDFTGAEAKSVSLDGPQISIYYPKAKTVQVYNIGAKQSEVDQFLLLGFGATSAELQKAYTVTFLGTESIGGVESWHLQLIPKSQDVLKHLTKAELWIGEMNGLPLQQKFFFPTGDTQTATYSNMEFNPSLPDRDLKLNYPKGVTVEHPQL